MNSDVSLPRKESSLAVCSQMDRRDTLQNSDRTIIERTNQMGLLPCLRRGSDRWWLPRTEQSTDALAMLLLAEGRRASRHHNVDPSTLERVERALISDPSFFIFTALSFPAVESVEVPEMASWLAENIAGRLASGDAYLGAPTVTPVMVRRWRKLADHFRTLPTEHWLEDANLWLEVAGPNVSNTWREQWPSIDVGEHPDLGESTDSSCMLQELARTVQRQRSLELAFDARLHKSKLGALKQLAYGLSHEINNPLANISTRAEQLQRGEADPARTATLQRIIDQVYRAHEMIADLMFYANPPALEQQPSDLKQIMRTVAESFRDETDRQAIRLEVAAPEIPAPMTVDHTMVGEAIRALVRNAIDAIGCQGTIVLSLDQDDGPTRIHVADSGPGLTDHARAHAFDPYFSGREAGRGLGLGLCRAYRIAKLHQGDITLAGGPAGCVATITLNPTEPA
ncbi:MAG: sensor histidine kinase [Rubripirellula sp.]